MYVCKYNSPNYAFLIFFLFCCCCHLDVFHYFLPPAYPLTLKCLLSSSINSWLSFLILYCMPACCKIPFTGKSCHLHVGYHLVLHATQSWCFRAYKVLQQKTFSVSTQFYGVTLTIVFSWRSVEAGTRPIWLIDNILYVGFPYWPWPIVRSTFLNSHFPLLSSFPGGVLQIGL